MNGPEHFQEAERLLDMAADIPSHQDDTNPGAALTMAEAQVHATLALAAATALGGHLPDPQFRKPLYPQDMDAWSEVAGTMPGRDGGGGPGRGASFSNSGNPDVMWMWRQLPRPLVTRFQLAVGDRVDA